MSVASEHDCVLYLLTMVRTSSLDVKGVVVRAARAAAKAGREATRRAPNIVLKGREKTGARFEREAIITQTRPCSSAIQLNAYRCAASAQTTVGLGRKRLMAERAPKAPGNLSPLILPRIAILATVNKFAVPKVMSAAS